MELMDIVDINDNVVGRAIREEANKKGLLHRIVHVLVFNDKGDLALQLRSKNVSYLNGYWTTSASGHVSSGETYEEAAIREYKEELGAAGKLEFFSKDLYEAGNLHKFLGVFKTVNNGPFGPGDGSVERVEFFTVRQMQKMVERRDKMHPELLFLLEKHYGIRT